MIIGFIIPIVWITIRDFFNDKIISKNDIEKITSYPIIGNILHSDKGSNLVVLNSPKSGISESFRAIRTNIQYLNSEKENKIISISSSISGEGKTYCSMNLASVFALSGSKTLLMQTKDGQIVEPYSISAGLDYPGVGPLHAHLLESKRAEFMSITDSDAMLAGLEVSKLEGIIPAIETAHAFAAFKYLDFKADDIIVVNFSGRGDKDLNTYIDYFNL